MKVLAIDDDVDTLYTISLAFELHWEGAVVLTARDGRRGLERMREHSPDVVILDMRLPGMDGFEVCRQIRGLYDVPVVMLSARNAEEDVIRGLDVGAEYYITKPFRARELIARVWAVARRRHQVPFAHEAPLKGLLTTTPPR